MNANIAGETLTAVGLPNDLLLLKRYVDESAFFELWGDQCIWSREGAAYEITPHQDCFLRLLRGTLERIELATGKTQWSTALPARAILGVYGEQVWLTGEALLIGVDLQSGAKRHQVPMTNNRPAEGILDQGGRFHSTTGLRYQIYDCSAGGSLMHDFVLGGANLAAGNLARIASHGRLVFKSDRGRLLLFDPGSPDALTLIATCDPPAPEFGIAHGKLWMLADGELKCFGE